MPKQKIKITPYKVQYICDVCQQGEMLPVMLILTTYPAQYPHTCNNCGHTQNFLKCYPSIVYEEVIE